MLQKQQKRARRHNRIRARIKGSDKTPRLCVFRSGRHLYAQLIDDQKNKTLASANDFEIKTKTKDKKDASGRVLGNKEALAFQIGTLLAEKAKKIKIEKVVFDRAGYKYHGKVKALAEGAREAGLKF